MTSLHIESGDALASKVGTLMGKYPSRVPVLVKLSARLQNEGHCLKRTKYLVPQTMAVGQFASIVRRQLTLPATHALYFVVGNTLPALTATWGALYSESEKESGCLVLHVSSDSTFG